MHGSAGHSDAGRGIPDEQIAYTTKNAAKVLDLSERKVAQLVADGEITSIKVGRARRIPRSALTAYIDKLAAQAAAETDAA